MVRQIIGAEQRYLKARNSPNIKKKRISLDLSKTPARSPKKISAQYFEEKQNNNEELWGFTPHYSPRVDNKVLQSKIKTAPTKKSLRKAAQKAARVAQIELAKKKEVDYQKYLYYAASYGALHGMLYVSTEFPGQVYEILVSQSSRKIQTWIHPILESLRIERARAAASISLQSIYKESMDNVLLQLKKESLIRQSIRRIQMHTQVRVFNSLRHNATINMRVRSHLRSRLLRNLSKHFCQWNKTTCNIIEKREALVKTSVTKILQRQLNSCFKTWISYSQFSKSLKARVANEIAITKTEVFSYWKNEFTPMHSKCRRAATTISRIYRGYVCRSYFKKQKAAATVIESAYRGFLTVKKIFLYRMQVADAQEQVRQKRVNAIHAVHRRNIATITKAHLHEAKRFTLEKSYVKKEVDFARLKVTEGIGGILPNEYKDSLKLTVDSLISRAREKGDYLSITIATSKATTILYADVEEKVRVAALCNFRKSNPPIVYCSSCLVPYSRAEYLETHDCTDNADQRQDKIKTFIELEERKRASEVLAVERQPILLTDLKM